jgi:hypothetical protein
MMQIFIILYWFFILGCIFSVLISLNRIAVALEEIARKHKD